MAAPLHNNLPPQSQQWVRDIERRMKALEQQNQLLQVTANQNAAAIGAVQEGLAFARTGVTSKTATNTFSGPSSGGVVSVELTKPSWAVSATIIGTLSLGVSLSVIDDEIYFYDAFLSTVGSGTTDLFAYPEVGIHMAGGSTLNGTAFPHTGVYTLAPDVTHVRLSGIVDTVGIHPASTYISYTSLTVIWSRTQFTAE